MSGIEMMLKSFGIDPEAIKAQVGEFQRNMASVIQNFDARLSAIETKLDTIQLMLRKPEIVNDYTRPAGVGPYEVLQNGNNGNDTGTGGITRSGPGPIGGF